MPQLPKDAQARFQSAFLLHAELGGPEAAAALTPKAMAGLILCSDFVHGLGKSILHWALQRAKDDPVEPISELLGALLEMKVRLSEEAERDLQEALARYLEDDGQRTLPLVESIIAGHARPAELARDADGVPEAGPGDMRGIEVTGCGDSEFNGIYIPQGTFNRKTKYNKASGGMWTEHTLRFWRDWDSWVLDKNAQATWYEVKANTVFNTDLPPSSGWTLSNRGKEPPPSAVSQLACVRAGPATRAAGSETSGSGAPEDPSDFVAACRKRGGDLSADVALKVAASWVRSNPKRLKTSAAWAAARPSVFAAVMASRPRPELRDDLESLSASWVQGARLSSMLEALTLMAGASGGIGALILSAVLGKARSKAASLEEQKAALGGSGLRDAWAAADEAQGEAAAARAEAAAARAEALAAGAREERARDEATARIEACAAERRLLEVVEVRLTAVVAELREGGPGTPPARTFEDGSKSTDAA